MKELPNVTLISYDNGGLAKRTLLALQHCASMIKFADVVFVCRFCPKGRKDERVHEVNEKGYRAAMIWEVAGVSQYVKTDFALCIHHDGFIINPDAWNDDWLQYDFIGSPWPLTTPHWQDDNFDWPNNRVGNTGFCLKSKPFMAHSRELSSDYDPGIAGDAYCCQIKRKEMERRGMKFAPIEVAADFGWEGDIEEFPQGRPDAFGFHHIPGKHHILGDKLLTTTTNSS